MKKFSEKVLKMLKKTGRRPVIIALEGNLGSGKTTFAQAFARAFGIKEKVLSPTFVLMKIYAPNSKFQIPNSKSKTNSFRFRHLIHIDCYRLNSPRELSHLGLRNLLKDKDAIILIEWADRIKKTLPKKAIWIKFRHGKKPNERVINVTGL